MIPLLFPDAIFESFSFVIVESFLPFNVCSPRYFPEHAREQNLRLETLFLKYFPQHKHFTVFSFFLQGLQIILPLKFGFFLFTLLLHIEHL